MRHGGYQIIDLKGTQLTVGTGMQYDGIYELIEGTNKTCLVSGLNVAGTEYNDCYVDFAVNGSAFEGTAYSYTITVESTNVVTVKNA